MPSLNRPGTSRGGSGDLILGLDRSAIGTLVERTTRFTMLLRLPPMDGHRDTPPLKNGPALAGHGAEAVRDAIASTITTLPEQLRRSLTWDQGSEMSQHARLRIDTGLEISFCDPHSPWQRGTNENTNGLLRQYSPKGTELGQAQPTRPRSRGAGAQYPTARDPRLEDPRRGPRRASTLCPTRRCCDDRLNPPNIRASPTPSGSERSEWSPRSAASAMPSTMPWRRLGSARSSRS